MHAIIRKLFGKTRSPHSAAPFRRTASLSVESLEKRELLTVGLGDPVWTPARPPVSVTPDGVLTITGTDGSDTVSVSMPANDTYSLVLNNYTVQMNGASYSVNALSVTKHAVYFSGGKGTDSFINNTGLDTYAFGLENDTFTGGSGVNYLYGGSGHNILTGGSGYSNLDGRTGQSVLIPGSGGASYSGSGRYASGDIAIKWRDLGGASVVGWPTTNELSDASGHYNHFDEKNYSIFSSPGTGNGTHEIHGYIRGDWLAMRAEDRSALGAPKTDETAARDGSGKYNDFAHGSIVWQYNAPAAHFMLAPIRDKWLSLTDADRSHLGYPTQDEVTVKAFPAADSYYSNFGRGIIYQWGGAPHLICDEIYDKWVALGGTGRNVVGTPTSDVYRMADGVGSYNNFTNGSIYLTPSKVAYEVHGSINEKYRQMGLATGVGYPMGYPVSDVRNARDGGEFSEFEHGYIYRVRSTIAAYQIYKDVIYDEWKALGWEWSHLGYPTSDEKITAGGRKCDFEGGSISWTQQGGVLATLNFHVAVPLTSKLVDGYMDLTVNSKGFYTFSGHIHNDSFADRWCSVMAVLMTPSGRNFKIQEQAFLYGTASLGNYPHDVDWVTPGFNQDLKDNFAQFASGSLLVG